MRLSSHAVIVSLSRLGHGDREEEAGGGGVKGWVTWCYRDSLIWAHAPGLIVGPQLVEVDA